MKGMERNPSTGVFRIRLTEPQPDVYQAGLFGSIEPEIRAEAEPTCPHDGDRQEQRTLDGRIDVLCCICGGRIET